MQRYLLCTCTKVENFCWKNCQALHSNQSMFQNHMCQLSTVPHFQVPTDLNLMVLIAKYPFDNIMGLFD